MRQLSWMFDCSRVPGTQGLDWSVSYAASPNPHDDLGHVIVIRKNRFWKIKAQVEGEVLGMGDLIRYGLSLRDSSVLQIEHVISRKVQLFSFSAYNTHICTTVNFSIYMTTARMNTLRSAH